MSHEISRPRTRTKVSVQARPARTLRFRIAQRTALGAALAIAALIASGSSAAPDDAAHGLATPLSRIVDYEPAWAPGGRRLAFVSNRSGPYKVWIMNDDHSDPRQLTTGNDEDDSPAWSPDGTRIAFVSIRGGRADIHVMSVDGTTTAQLTHGEGDNIHPQWSPDGTRILFNSSRNSRDTADPDVFEIFSIRPDGSDLQALTRGGIATYASYSPDGGRLVFRRQFADGNSEIVVRPVEGGEEINLSRHPAFDGWPAWSRDGRRVVFARERSDTSDTHAEILVVDVATLAVTPLVDGPGRNTNPRWSPTDDRVVFSRRADLQVRLWLIPAPPPNGQAAGSSPRDPG